MTSRCQFLPIQVGDSVLTVTVSSKRVKDAVFRIVRKRKISRCLIAVRPILFHLPFGIPVYAYGFMLTVSVIVGRLLAIRLAERVGIDAEAGRSLCDLDARRRDRRLPAAVRRRPTSINSLTRCEVFALWEGGVVAYGGFVGGLVAAILYCRIQKIRLLAWADCVVPSLCVGLGLTRIGCFLGGCDFGRVWEGPWAMRFPAGSPAFQEHRLLGLLPSGAAASLPVHPTQLYESLAGLVLLLVVLAVRRRQRVSGHALAAFAVGYGVLRYLHRDRSRRSASRRHRALVHVTVHRHRDDRGRGGSPVRAAPKRGERRLRLTV